MKCIKRKKLHTKHDVYTRIDNILREMRLKSESYLTCIKLTHRKLNAHIFGHLKIENIILQLKHIL